DSPIVRLRWFPFRGSDHRLPIYDRMNCDLTQRGWEPRRQVLVCCPCDGSDQKMELTRALMNSRRRIRSPEITRLKIPRSGLGSAVGKFPYPIVRIGVRPHEHEQKFRGVILVEERADYGADDVGRQSSTPRRCAGYLRGRNPTRC